MWIIAAILIIIFLKYKIYRYLYLY